MPSNDPWNSVLSSIANAALYLLALPITLVLSLRDLGAMARTIRQIREGKVTCRFCGTENPLGLMARCPACSAVEPGSRLRCSFCNTVYQVISCSGCGATLRVV